MLAAGVASTPLSSDSLVLNPNSLPHRVTLVFRITATDSGGSAYADLSVEVSAPPLAAAGSGAALGVVQVSPASGLGLDTVFTALASGWEDIDLPLMYSFAYVVEDGAGVNQEPTPISPFSPQGSAQMQLPGGVASGGYVVNVSVTVANAFGVRAQPVWFPLTVQWDPEVLSDPAAQASLVSAQTNAARLALLSGSPNAALSVVSGLARLLNQAATAPVGGGDANATTQEQDAAAQARDSSSHSPFPAFLLCLEIHHLDHRCWVPNSIMGSCWVPAGFLIPPSSGAGFLLGSWR